MVYRKARSYLYFLLIITLLCMSVFLQSTNLECLMLVWFLVLHEKINACSVRVATRGLYVKRFWSGTEINECCCGITGRVFCKVLLVHVYQTGPIQDSALNCFASLRQITQCVWCAIYRYFPELSHSSNIFPPRGENVMITKTIVNFC